MNSRACVRVGNGVSNWFSCQSRDVPRECELSPYLFNTYMNGVARGINAELLHRGLSLLSEDGRE